MACTTMAPSASMTGRMRSAIPAGSFRHRIVRIAAAALRWLTARPVVLSDPHLEVLLVRRDDRLLDDAGLTAEDTMGRWRHFRERELEPVLRHPPR